MSHQLQPSALVLVLVNRHIPYLALFHHPSLVTFAKGSLLTISPPSSLSCSDAWLGLLRLPLPSDLLKKVLVQLHSTVIPHIPNPLLLSDFLTGCLGQGGLVGMLALNGIFTLVTKHGLEYPNFYARLYALLQVCLLLPLLSSLLPSFCPPVCPLWSPNLLLHDQDLDISVLGVMCVLLYGYGCEPPPTSGSINIPPAMGLQDCMYSQQLSSNTRIVWRQRFVSCCSRVCLRM